MINTSLALNLDKNIKSLKSNYKKDNNSNEIKVEFRKYLSNEGKDNKLNINKKTNINKEPESYNEELSKSISENIEKIINKDDLDISISEKEIQDLINLLINFLEINSNENKLINSEELANINSDNLDELLTLDFKNTNIFDFNSNTIKTMFEETSDEFSNNNNFINLDSNTVSSIKDTLTDINNLLQKYIENINLNKSKNDNLSNNINNELMEKTKDLLSIIPENTIKKVEDNLDNSLSREIFNALILSSGKADISESDKNLTINNEKLNYNNENSTTTFTNKENTEEIKNNFSNNYYDDNFKKELSKDYSIENNTNDDKVLMNILKDDKSTSFSNNLNYYNNLNKINSDLDVIKDAVTINKESLNGDFIKNIKYMVRNSLQEINVKIYPEELGEMTIKLLSEEGIMKAEIKATSKETYNLLNSNLNEIKKTLEEQNIKIQEVNIGIYNEDTTFFSGDGESKEYFQIEEFDGVKKSNLEEEIIEDLLNEGNVNLLA